MNFRQQLTPLALLITFLSSCFSNTPSQVVDTTPIYSNVSIVDTAADSAAARMKRFKKLNDKQGKLLGLWIDTSESALVKSKLGYKLSASRNHKLFIESCNPDSESHSVNSITTISGLAAEVKKGKHNRYTDVESGEYYIINESGDLMLYDNYGWFATCPKAF